MHCNADAQLRNAFLLYFNLCLHCVYSLGKQHRAIQALHQALPSDPFQGLRRRTRRASAVRAQQAQGGGACTTAQHASARAARTGSSAMSLSGRDHEHVVGTSVQGSGKLPDPRTSWRRGPCICHAGPSICHTRSAQLVRKRRVRVGAGHGWGGGWCPHK